jgi:hypothetical protein
MGTFIAGTGRLGPSRASIVSAVQPALTVVLGFAVYSDRLGPLQLLGGTLVVAGVVVLETGAASSESRCRPSWLPASEGRTLTRVGPSIDVPAGTRVVGQGERAQAFFLIEHGHATVTRDGRYIADLGPGDFFGEIALLGGGMRTASVVAASDMRVRVVPRHAFAQALRTLPSLARAVRRVSEERLHRSPALSAPAA